MLLDNVCAEQRAEEADPGSPARRRQQEAGDAARTGLKERAIWCKTSEALLALMDLKGQDQAPH